MTLSSFFLVYLFCLFTHVTCKAQLRHNKEKGTELDRKGREGKGRYEKRIFFCCCCCDNFVYKSFGSFESVVVGGRGGEGQGGEVQDFLIHHL
jgi:hypothetical protein